MKKILLMLTDACAAATMFTGCDKAAEGGARKLVVDRVAHRLRAHGGDALRLENVS